MQLIQNDDFSLTINQNNYTDCIFEIKLSNERLKENNIATIAKQSHTQFWNFYNNSQMSNEEKTSYRSAVGQLNWIYYRSTK